MQTFLPKQKSCVNTPHNRHRYTRHDLSTDLAPARNVARTTSRGNVARPLVAYNLSLDLVMEKLENKSVVESLILEVRNRPCLWDKKHELYKNRGCVDKLWDEVAEAINKNKDQIKIKWRNLRDQFSRELKKNPVAEDGSPIVDQYSGKWAYYDMLTFLKDNVYYIKSEDRHDDTQDDLTGDDLAIKIKCDPDLDEEIGAGHFLDPLDAPDIHEDTSDSTLMPTGSNESPPRRLSQRKAKSSYVQRQIGLQNDRLQNLQTARLSSRDVDDDLHFALSLVPYLRNLDPLRKLIVRNEMQNLLIGELIGETSSRMYGQKK